MCTQVIISLREASEPGPEKALTDADVSISQTRHGTPERPRGFRAPGTATVAPCPVAQWVGDYFGNLWGNARGAVVAQRHHLQLPQETQPETGKHFLDVLWAKASLYQDNLTILVLGLPKKKKARKDAVAIEKQCLERAYEHYREWRRHHQGGLMTAACSW